MYPGDYKGYTTVFDKIDSNTGRRTILLRVSRKADECPECGSPKVYRQQQTNHAQLDVTEEGEYVDIHLEGQRYRCQNCGKTFANWPFSKKFGSKTKVTDDVLKYVIDQMSLSQTSIMENARAIGVSPKVISDALHKRIEQTKKRIDSYIPLEQLFLVPFDYKRKHICVIGGFAPSNQLILPTADNAVILDVLEVYDVNAINEVVSKCCEFVDDVFAVHAKPDCQILETLHIGFKKSLITVLVDCIRNLISANNNDVDGMYNQRLNALSALRVLLKSENSKTFADSFDAWWSVLDDALRPSLQFLHDIIIQNITEVAQAMDYREDQAKFIESLAFIKNCRRQNVCFETMRYYLLCKSNARMSGNYPACAYDDSNDKDGKPTKYYDFYIRLADLNKETQHL